MGAVRIRSDVERKRLFGLKPLDRSQADGSDIYTSDSTTRTFARLAELARSIVEAGFSVIVDATFLTRELRTPFLQLAHQLGVPFAILDFRASERCLRERIERRLVAGHDASEADIAVLTNQLRADEPFDEIERPYVIALDSEASDAVAVAISRLNQL